ncbi:MAG TPA: ribosome silencing factor [Ramlibacter sp.]|jgi:ribosome-associated protein|nr:ribosome silencing factor [Ramlibacter sp.]
MTTETAAKKDTQKLQRAIIDGLEDVKGQDIQVFNTEHLSPLFERVIVASGTSNRQTKALASSVVDAVREAGFPKPRIEGEENGEWIIVDCGAAVAHIMQPAIRQYYHLEEIWGEKPIRLRLGAPKPAAPERAPAPAAKKAPSPSLRRTTAVKTMEREASAAKKAAKKTAARKASGKTGAASTARTALGKVALKAPAAGKSPARSAGAKSVPAKSAPAKSAPVKSAPAKSAAAKKPAAKKSPA